LPFYWGTDKSTAFRSFSAKTVDGSNSEMFNQFFMGVQNLSTWVYGIPEEVHRVSGSKTDLLLFQCALTFHSFGAQHGMYGFPRLL
jgi:hypothetical protein